MNGDPNSTDAAKPRDYTDAEKEMFKNTRVVLQKHRMEVELEVIDLERRRAEALAQMAENDLKRSAINIQLQQAQLENYERQVENNINHEKLLLRVIRQIEKQNKLIAGILGIVAGAMDMDPNELKQKMMTGSVLEDDEADSDSGSSGERPETGG